MNEVKVVTHRISDVFFLSLSSKRVLISTLHIQPTIINSYWEDCADSCIDSNEQISLSLSHSTHNIIFILLLFFYYAISFMKFTHWILYFMHEWKQKNKTWNERRVSFTRILFLRICWGNQGNACLYSIIDVSMKLSLK